MKKVIVFVGLLLVLPQLSYTKPKGFYLERLPRGKNITIPLPATLYVSLKNRVVLKPTDRSQTIKLSPIHIHKGRVSPIRIAIYDQNAERVKYADVKPNLPFLYNFKGLDKISLVPDKMTKRIDRNLRLQIESNKPLEISR